MIKYNREWPADFSELDIELRCFLWRLSVADGGLGTYEHLKRAIQLIWPVGNRKHFIFTPEAERMLKKACEYRYLGVAGGASMCKTDTFAVYALVCWLADPLNTMILVTSTSLKDSRKRIWGSIVDYFMSAEVPMPGKLADSIGLIRTTVPGFKASDKCGIHLIAGEKKKEKEAIGKIIGIKSQRLIMIGDELSELSPAIIEATSNLDNNPMFQLIGLANPSSIYDPHGILCTPKNGWNSVDVENSDGWETERGYAIRLDAEKSQNYLMRKIVYPFMPSYEKIEEAKARWGPKSKAYARMYKAFWCPDDKIITVFSEADLLRSRSTLDGVVWLGTPEKVAGLDIGYSTGGDRSIFIWGLYGLDREGIPTLQVLGYEELKDDTSKKSESHPFQIAAQARDLCLKYEIPSENLGVDVTGVGGTMFMSILNHLWEVGPLGCQFGGWASERMVGPEGQRKKARDVYANRATEMWMATRDYIMNGQVRGMFPALGAELVNRKTVDRQRGAEVYTAIESKPDLRKRTGRSCDIADAFVILVDLVRTRFNFKTMERPESRTSEIVGSIRPVVRAPRTAKQKWRNLTNRLAAVNGGARLRDENSYGW